MAGELCPTCRGRKTVVAKGTVGSAGAVMGFEGRCPTCKGTGYASDPEVCTKCNGSTTMVARGFEVRCDACNGTGLRKAQEMGAEA